MLEQNNWCCMQPSPKHPKYSYIAKYMGMITFNMGAFKSAKASCSFNCLVTVQVIAKYMGIGVTAKCLIITRFINCWILCFWNFVFNCYFKQINWKPVAKIRFVLVLAFLRNNILNRESKSTVRKVCPQECMYCTPTLTNSQTHSHIHPSLIHSLVYSLIRCPKILSLPKSRCFQNPVAKIQLLPKISWLPKIPWLSKSRGSQISLLLNSRPKIPWP